MKKSFLLILVVSFISACAYHRFQSIATCEFEYRNFIGTTMWSSSNCLGNKDDDSHLKEAADELRKDD